MLSILRGLLIGLAILAIIWWISSIQSQPSAISETEGKIKTIYIQFNTEGESIVAKAYIDLFKDLRCRVLVGCPDQKDFEHFVQLLGKAGIQDLSRFKEIITNRAISCWSKDRFIVVRRGKKLQLLAPERSPLTPMGKNDWMVAWDVARFTGAEIRTLPIDFDGGDIWVTGGLAFVHQCVFEKNGDFTEEEIKSMLEDELGAKVIVINGPPHHIGMFMTPLDNKTIVLGNPDLAAGLADLSHKWIGSTKSLREQLKASGFRVIDIPFAPQSEDRVYITYNNVVIDAGRVFMPVYGVKLDNLAKSVWQSLGFEVITIDSQQLLPHRGAIHCLVNVLERS